MPAPKPIIMCHVSDTEQRKIRSRKSRLYWLNFSKRATLWGLTWDRWFLCHVTARTQLLQWVCGRQERKETEHSFFLMHSPNLCNDFLSSRWPKPSHMINSIYKKARKCDLFLTSQNWLRFIYHSLWLARVSDNWREENEYWNLLCVDLKRRTHKVSICK